MLGKDPDVTGATGHTADGFASLLDSKVDGIRVDTSGTLPPVITDRASSSLPSFQPVAVSDVRRIIMSSPMKSSYLDPWPTFLLRECVGLAPYVTERERESERERERERERTLFAKQTCQKGNRPSTLAPV